MKKIGPVILLLIVLSGIAAAASNFQAAYERAAQEADPATAKMVSSIDLQKLPTLQSQNYKDAPS